MHEVWTWIVNHEVELLGLLAALWALISLIVRLTPTPDDDAVLARVWAVIERASFLQHRDGRGTWSVPGRPTKPQTEPEQKLLTGRIK